MFLVRRTATPLEYSRQRKRFVQSFWDFENGELIEFLDGLEKYPQQEEEK